MNIKWLEYYMTTVKCGSMNEAAQKLGISQPALTKAIASLEKEYGIPLLIRSRNGVELTPEARKFSYYASKVVSAAHILQDNYTGQEKEKTSRLFLATQNFDFVGETVEKLYSLCGGNIHFSISEENRDDVAEQVLEGNADLGLMVVNSKDGNSLLWNARKKELDICILDKSRIFAAVGPNSSLYEGKTAEMEILNQQPALVLDMGGNARTQLNIDNSSEGINLKRVVFTNSVETCRWFLMNTDMIMYIAKWSIRFLDKSIHILDVVDFPENDRKNLNYLVLLKRKDTELNETGTAYLQILSDYFGKKDGLIFGAEVW